jgi:hypothetical protein
MQESKTQKVACLAHVIQLALFDLLGKSHIWVIFANPAARRMH